MNDEQFATGIRPDSIFGSLGASDHFDEDEQFGEMAEGWGGTGDPLQAALPDYSSAPPAPPRVPGPGPSMLSPMPPPALSNTGGRASAALGILLVAAGGVVGWHFGRFKGAAGGVLVAGAARNLYRAQRDMRSEDPSVRASSVRPGLIGLVGLGGGGYLLYTADGR